MRFLLVRLVVPLRGRDDFFFFFMFYRQLTKSIDTSETRRPRGIPRGRDRQLTVVPVETVPVVTRDVFPRTGLTSDRFRVG